MKNRFCTQCGNVLTEKARFCDSCGAPVEIKSTEGYVTEPQGEETRKTVYEGKLFKCPNCGEVLNSFTSNCPACGYELRGTKAVSSVREFAAKLEAIEAKRESMRANPIRDLYFGKAATKTDEQKISLIKSFSIPNTKEDLYEFLILASSNINTDMYDSGTIRPTDVRLAVSDAWRAKFDQAYQKAKLVFAGDSRLAEIEKLYEKTHRSIKNSKWKSWKLVGILYAVLFAIFGIIFLCVAISSASSEKKEIARLEAIVEDIEEALDNEEYKYALMYADSLQCNPNCLDDGTERQWEIQREYWIDKIIEEAEKAGIQLERPVDDVEEDKADEQVEQTPVQQEGYEDPFSQGFNDALSEAEDEIQENIDLFWENLNGGNNTEEENN